MTLLQWKDEYSVCIDPVDRERRELIDLVDRLHDELDRPAAESPASVAELLESISAHLALEEKMAQDRARGEQASHKADHERLIDELCDLIIMRAFEDPDDADGMELARRLDSWLCSHIRTKDANFRRKLTAVPVEASSDRSGAAFRLALAQIKPGRRKGIYRNHRVGAADSRHRGKSLWSARSIAPLEQLKAQSGVQRVAEFLAALAPNEHGPCVVALPYDKVLIAARLGLKPESLSRAFTKLRSVGVEVHASHVAVGDIARLRQLAADDRSAIRGSLR